MRQSVIGVLTLGSMLVMGLVPAQAQTSIALTDSGSTMLSFSGRGTGSLTADLGTCGLFSCWLSGAAAGATSDAQVTGTALSVAGPASLLGAAGSMRTPTALAGSLPVPTGSGGTVLFTGDLSSLSVDQPPSSADGFTQMSGGVTGAVGNISLSGAVGANLAGVAGYGGSGSAPIVPEPASMILFGSGLLLLGGVLRRRSA